MPSDPCAVLQKRMVHSLLFTFFTKLVNIHSLRQTVSGDCVTEKARRIRMQSKLPVAVIGAGPVGLAAAAHLAARGEAFVVLETGASVGHSMLQWGHVRVFSPWRYNVDRTARRLLESTGWRHPAPDALPTGREIVEEYLDPLASLLTHEGSIRVGVRVIAVGRHDFDKVTSAGRDVQPFLLRLATDNGEEELLARAVIDASGTWCTPNPLGSGGYLVNGETLA